MVNGKLDSQLQVDEHRCSKKSLSHVCFACCMFCFLSFFLAFGCCINFGFGERGKTGAWAPDIVAGGEGEQEATNAAFRPRWREQLWGPGGKGNFFCAKIYIFFAFS